MASLADLTNIKRRVETAKTESARAAGALEQTLQRLKKEHGCNSLEEAEKKLEKLTAQTQAAEAEFDKALKLFEEEYGAEL
jgi:predicted secreted Zn-dependent protease